MNNVVVAESSGHGTHTGDIDRFIFPETMDSTGHQIVHDIVVRGNVMKDFVDEFFFFIKGGLFEAKVCRCFFGL